MSIKRSASHSTTANGQPTLGRGGGGGGSRSIRAPRPGSAAFSNWEDAEEGEFEELEVGCPTAVHRPHCRAFGQQHELHESRSAVYSTVLYNKWGNGALAWTCKAPERRNLQELSATAPG